MYRKMSFWDYIKSEAKSSVFIYQCWSYSATYTYMDYQLECMNKITKKKLRFPVVKINGNYIFESFLGEK